MRPGIGSGPSSGLYRDDPLPIIGAISCAGGLDQRAAYAYSPDGGIWKIMFGGSPEEVPERYAATNPRDMLPLGIPQLLIHGDADQVIHISWSKSYFNIAAATGDRVRLIVIDNADHLGIRDPASTIGRQRGTRSWSSAPKCSGPFTAPPR